ncbi:WD repeat and SOCS box-containing protein 1-like [Paramacrobiotus metropolitanus]|uniref:WD repeat and SOCS box-containing protein 1-like n=1 Tax=Paramacrobiotus metropolitanus TaxID=2943436 RepID=UPI002446266E|nr:WD repeat and SOCS box-containing protein 1-like [Paramacrobiotus metropolitanus]
MAGKSAETEAGPWTMVAQVRSDDSVYRRVSSVATSELLERSRRSKFGEEIMSSAWSPDGSLFAWAVGTELVSIHNVAQILHTDRPATNENPESLGRVAVLDCGAGASVTCMYFGSRVSDVKWHSGEVKYNRFEEQMRGQMLLAVGLATGDIKIFDVATGKMMMVLKDHTDAVTDLQFSPDGSLVLLSASKDTSVKLWDLLDDGNMFRTLPRLDSGKRHVKDVSWSPDAKRIATVGDGKMAVLWEVKNYEIERQLEGHQNDVTGVRFHEDGRRLFTCSFDTRVICWNISDGKKLFALEHMQPPPTSIFASGTNEHEVTRMDLRGNQLASLCNDGMLRIWNVAGDSQPAAPEAVLEIVPDAKSISFSDNGRVLAVGCLGGILQFYARSR